MREWLCVRVFLWALHDYCRCFLYLLRLVCGFACLTLLFFHFHCHSVAVVYRRRYLWSRQQPEVLRLGRRGLLPLYRTRWWRHHDTGPLPRRLPLPRPIRYREQGAITGIKAEKGQAVVRLQTLRLIYKARDCLGAILKDMTWYIFRAGPIKVLYWRKVCNLMLALHRWTVHYSVLLTDVDVI